MYIYHEEEETDTAVGRLFGVRRYHTAVIYSWMHLQYVSCSIRMYDACFFCS